MTALLFGVAAHHAVSRAADAPANRADPQRINAVPAELVRNYSAPADWWNREWPCRKTVAVARVGAYDGDLAAVAVFTTGGRLMDDAADLRVIDDKGREVPYEVVAAGFDDSCSVVFPVEYEGQQFQFYYGYGAARAPKSDWTPKRGLILEVRTRGNGDVGTWDQMRALIENSPEVQGRAVHGCVFDGCNPFGSSDNYVSIYRGVLLCPVAGSYDFATTSSDASFLFVDEDLVVQWPGRHEAVADARHHVEVPLEAGAHRFEYYHVEFDGGQVAEAAWRTPRGGDFTVIPPEAFAPFWWGQVVAYQCIDDSVGADFSFAQLTSVPLGDSVVSAVRFSLDFPRDLAAEDRTWDFGDGIATMERSPVHVYARPGLYRVRLSVAGRAYVQRVRVWNNERVSEANPELVAKDYLKAFASYDLRAMNAQDLLAIDAFATEFGDPGLAFNAVETMKNAVDGYRDAAVGRRLLDHATDLWWRGAYDAAIGTLDLLVSRHTDREIGLIALYRRAEYLIVLGKGDEASAAVQQLSERAADVPGFARLAHDALGDYQRFRGNAKAAREEYARATAPDAAPAGMPLARGAYAQAALEYLRTGEFAEALKQVEAWEDAIPLDKLDGYLSLLKAVALIRTGDLARANAEARDQAAANPDGNYAPHVLLLEGDCCALWGNLDKAKACYRQAVEKYPESPIRAIAEQRAEYPPQDLTALRFPVVDF